MQHLNRRSITQAQMLLPLLLRVHRATPPHHATQPWVSPQFAWQAEGVTPVEAWVTRSVVAVGSPEGQLFVKAVKTGASVPPPMPPL